MTEINKITTPNSNFTIKPGESPKTEDLKGLNIFGPESQGKESIKPMKLGGDSFTVEELEYDLDVYQQNYDRAAAEYEKATTEEEKNMAKLQMENNKAHIEAVKQKLEEAKANGGRTLSELEKTNQKVFEELGLEKYQ